MGIWPNLTGEKMAIFSEWNGGEECW
jgi:hypothetical protein